MRNKIRLTLMILCLPIISIQAQRISRLPQTFSSASGQQIKGYKGLLYVLENRGNPNSDTIQVQFVQLKSTNTESQKALIYLEGGPGSACTWQADNPEALENWLPFLAVGDIILLDQRGTGIGQQRVTYIWRDSIPKDALISVEKAYDHMQKMYSSAATHFEQMGVDLNGYTTMQNAHDIDDLRKALGYPKLNLYGFSYGTHLGLTYMKYYPDQVERSLLVGVEGLDETYKLPSTMDLQFSKIANLSNQDPNVNKEVPDLIALYDEVVNQLSSDPVEITIQSPLTRKPEKLLVGPFGLNLVLRLDMGDASDIPVIPRLLHSIKQGDYGILQWFIQKRYITLVGVQGMSGTMDKASGVSLERKMQIDKEKQNSRFGDVMNPRLELDFAAPDLGEEFRSAFSSNIPTLFMSGTLDMNTPPMQAEKARWGFSDSHHIIVENAGHEQIIRHPESVPAMVHFLETSEVQSQLLSLPSIQFIPVNGDTEGLFHPSLK